MEWRKADVWPDGICCGMLFHVLVFFSPLFLSIPSAATASALVIVGLLMVESMVKIPFHDFSELLLSGKTPKSIKFLPEVP